MRIQPKRFHSAGSRGFKTVVWNDQVSQHGHTRDIEVSPMNAEAHKGILAFLIHVASYSSNLFVVAAV